VSLQISMLDAVLKVLVHSSVHDVEEIVSRWKSTLREFIGKVAHEVRVLLEDRPQLRHR
jgi:hypothetical protein